MKQFRVMTTMQSEPKTISADDWKQEMNGFLTFYAGENEVFAIRHDYVVSIETVSPVIAPAGLDMRPGALNPIAA